MNTKTANTKPDAKRIPSKRATITPTPCDKPAGRQTTPPATTQPGSKRQRAQLTAKALPVPAAPGTSKQSRIIDRLKIAPGASIAQKCE